MSKSLSKKVQPASKRQDVGERRLCGLGACLARFESRPETIVRAYVLRERLPQVGELLAFLAAHRKAYHVVDKETLAKVFGSSHHEGIGLLVKDSVRPGPESFLESLEKTRQGTEQVSLVLLDGVENPHNLGAIARVAAHFGISALWAGALSLSKTLSDPFQSSFFRTAEGGAEALHLGFGSHAETIALVARLKKQGFRIYGTSGQVELRPQSVFDVSFATKSVFICGSEGNGVSKELLAACDEVLIIPGSGAVESLNVACASSVVLGEFQRQRARGVSKTKP